MAKASLEWIDVVSRFIELTQDGELVWEAGQPFKSIGQDNSERIESVFTSNYKGKKLRIYKRTYQSYQIPSNLGPKGGYITDEVVLEIIADNGLTLWTFPKVHIIRDLLKAVQYEVAGVEELLDQILKDAVLAFS